jgi:hypothetical protein
MKESLEMILLSFIVSLITSWLVIKDLRVTNMVFICKESFFKTFLWLSSTIVNGFYIVTTSFWPWNMIPIVNVSLIKTKELEM